MREVRLQINGLVCEAHLLDSHCNVLAETRIELNGPTNWYELLAKVGDELKLADHPPPGLPTQVWQVIRCGKPHCPGWGWGFYLPFDRTKQQVPVQTCCGFRSESAAAGAAKFVRGNLDVIEGGPPGGTFEVFGYAGNYAFIDLNGIVHSFSDRQHAQSHAAKLEATQMQPS